MTNLRAVGCLVIILTTGVGQPSWGQTAGNDTLSLFEHCRSDTAARIRFLEQSLDENRDYAQYYFGGWLSFYTIGVGFSSYRASTNERGERAVQIASAIKAVGGIGRLLYWQPNARRGADASRGLPATNEAECATRLKKAEEELQINEHEANRRWGWKSHVYNAAIHVASAIIVGEVWGARKDAWGQAAVGTVVGEGIIWSYPWQANELTEEYERRFPATGLPPEPRVSWGLAPTLGGAGLYVRF